jgi:hypothetical protein
MRNTDHLTDGYAQELAAAIRATKPGQAHWGNTGPFGAVCKDCTQYGYYKQGYKRGGGTLTTTFRPRACGKFHKLTGKHGPDFPGTTPACKYFERQS